MNLSCFSCTNEQQGASVGRRSRLPTEPGSYSGADIVSDNLLPNINSPIKSPPYSGAECDDNSFKGTGNRKLAKLAKTLHDYGEASN